MTVSIFRSTDGGAPTYKNVAGALIGVLDYALVGLGWTKTVLGTNQASYQQPGGSNGRFLQVDDSGAASAAVTGWETLTALSTGTYQFPNTGAGNNSHNNFVVDHASTSAAVPWRLITNGSLFHFIVNYNTSLGYWNLFTFGDYVSNKVGHLFNTMIGAQTSAGQANTLGYLTSNLGQGTQNPGCIGLDRAMNQVTVSPQGSVVTKAAWLNSPTSPGVGGPAYPDPISGSVNMAPIWVFEFPGSNFFSANAGFIPGIWCPCHATNSFTDGDTFSVSAGTQAGKTFEIAAHGTGGQIFLETSNTWGGTF